MNRTIAADWVLPVTGEPIRRGVLEFAADGRLVSVGTYPEGEVPAGAEYYSGAVVPGFVNTHCHLELSYMKDFVPEHTGLPGFVKIMMETKFTFSVEDQKEAIGKADREMWESGIQAVGDISNTVVSFDTKQKSPIRYVTYFEIFDVLTGGNTQAVIEQGRELSRIAREKGLEGYITLHAPYSVSDRLFTAYASLEDTERLSIHYMESPDDDLLFHRQGKFYRLFEEKGYEVDFIGDGSSTRRILRHVPADRKVLLVHNSNVAERDILVLKERYKDLSWALCPLSNLYIEQKLPPVDLLRRNDLNLTIGTDSLSSNHGLSMADEIRKIGEYFQVPFPEVLRWATLNGARALGCEKEMGSFEPGKTPGAVLVEGLGPDLRFTGDPITSRRLL